MDRLLASTAVQKKMVFEGAGHEPQAWTSGKELWMNDTKRGIQRTDLLFWACLQDVWDAFFFSKNNVVLFRALFLWCVGLNCAGANFLSTKYLYGQEDWMYHDLRYRPHWFNNPTRYDYPGTVKRVKSVRCAFSRCHLGKEVLNIGLLVHLLIFLLSKSHSRTGDKAISKRRTSTNVIDLKGTAQLLDPHLTD